MLSSVVITQPQTMMSKLRRLGILKYSLEQLTPQKQFQLLGIGALHGIRHHEQNTLPFHTELENWQIMLSISLGFFLQLTYISMIGLSFSTKLSSVMLELVRIWSLQTSTNSQISDQPTWTQLVPLLFNMHFSLSSPVQPLRRKYLNCATIGMRVYAHWRLLSVTNFIFVTNSQAWRLLIMNFQFFDLYICSPNIPSTMFNPIEFSWG